MRLIAQYRQAFMPHAYQLHERSRACCLNLTLPYGCYVVPSADFGAP